MQRTKRPTKKPLKNSPNLSVIPEATVQVRALEELSAAKMVLERPAEPERAKLWSQIHRACIVQVAALRELRSMDITRTLGTVDE